MGNIAKWMLWTRIKHTDIAVTAYNV